MLRLFEVDGAFFDNKKEAKKLRNNLNATGNAQAKVHLGPDHRDYGIKKNPTTHHNRMLKNGKKYAS